MRTVRHGVAAVPGVAVGPAFVLQWDTPHVQQGTIQQADVEKEIERFHEAREWAKRRIAQIRDRTAQRLGAVEAQIFEPQILMLDDPEMIEGTTCYIRENRFSAARAFELRMLEYRSAWTRSGHPMILDRLNDLIDLELRVIRRLLGMQDPDFTLDDLAHPVILVAHDLTPSIIVQIEHSVILGIATDSGTRTSHSAILARSLNLPAVVNLGDISTLARDGREIALDGATGRVIVEPTAADKGLFRRREATVHEWERELMPLTHLEAVTPDDQPVLLRANIDLPTEATAAAEHGASGVGLFRTEFLVVGRNSPPGEEEQFESYRMVAEAFPGQAVFIRTFDLGGDKFPVFLNMPPEENPFLGWRAIRVSLDLPEIFRIQLRALLRATAHGDIRIMLPMVSDVGQVERTRELIDRETELLRHEGVAYNHAYKLGVMIETPAAALIAPELARLADFFSIGTNDLVQYTLAVDRGNARLAHMYNPFHPSVLRLLDQTAAAGREAGIEVSVCGEIASDPLGIYLFLGLGISTLSVGPASLLEAKKVIRSVPASDARKVVRNALNEPTSEAVAATLSTGLGQWVDLSMFASRWSLSAVD